MARTRFVNDHGLSFRMMLTMGGLGLLYVLLAGVLYALGFNAFWVLAISGGLLFAQWWFSDSLAMRSMGAVVVTPEQAPKLHALVDGICAAAGMNKPRIGIADTDVPNAFATGRTPARSVIVVTTGLLRRLDADELEGVLAHELSHVAHRDVTVMTIASFTAIIAGFLARWAMWGSMFRDNRNGNAALIGIAVMLVSVVVYFAAFLLIRALSRYRELGADRGAALLTRKPSALASALQKISVDMETVPNGAIARTEAVSSLAIMPALLSGRGFSLERLFATHPSLDKRLLQLARLSNEMGESAR